MYQTPNQRKPSFFAGVDPDLEKSGLAIWSTKERRFILLSNLDYARLQEAIRGYTPNEITVVVEAAWLHGSIMYKRHKKNLPKEFDTWTEEGKMGYMFARGADVGRNFAIGQTLVHYLKTNGYTVEELKPESEKWDSDTFKALTRLTVRTNQEVRDAAKLVFGR